MKKGFTLIELLVVVLIIGVLTAIALPQYEGSMEKTRVSEALVMLKAISDAEQRYWQAQPNQDGQAVKRFSKIADVDLKGGCLVEKRAYDTNGDSYRTRNFTYDLGHPNGVVLAYRIDRTGDLCEDVVTKKEDASYILSWGPNAISHGCDHVDGSDIADSICNFVQKM